MGVIDDYYGGYGNLACFTDEDGNVDYDGAYEGYNDVDVWGQAAHGASSKGPGYYRRASRKGPSHQKRATTASRLMDSATDNNAGGNGPLPPHARFRTVTCRHWAQGHCVFEDTCHFAHTWLPGAAPSSHVPGAKYKPVATRQAEADVALTFGGGLTGGGYGGGASSGGATDDTGAARGHDQHPTPQRMSAAGSVVASVMLPGSLRNAAPYGAHPYHSAGAAHPRHKTVMCRAWQAHGACRYGTGCTFAHGEEELRTMP